MPKRIGCKSMTLLMSGQNWKQRVECKLSRRFKRFKFKREMCRSAQAAEGQTGRRQITRQVKAMHTIERSIRSRRPLLLKESVIQGCLPRAFSADRVSRKLRNVSSCSCFLFANDNCTNKTRTSGNEERKAGPIVNERHLWFVLSAQTLIVPLCAQSTAGAELTDTVCSDTPQRS